VPSPDAAERDQSSVPRPGVEPPGSASGTGDHAITDADEPHPGKPDPGTGFSQVLFDRQAGRRIAYSSSARLQWGAHDLACATLQLSLQGLTCTFAASRPTHAPPLGTRVRITLVLNGALAPLPARVAWSRTENGHAHVGLHFDPLSDQLGGLLTEVIRSDPA
jgi:hypothetical protein